MGFREVSGPARRLLCSRGMNRGVVLMLLGIAIPGCGEDKGYGDPIDDPNATQSALGAVINAQALTSMASNDSALNAVNALSANFNLLTGAKYNGGVEQRPIAPAGARDGRLQAVADTCVVVTSTTVTYTDCDFAGASVDGTVTVDGDFVSVDVRFDSQLEDISQTTDVRADVIVSATEITGFVDFDLDISAGGSLVTSTFDGDFDVDLVDGCAVGGDLEVHAAASGNGRSISVWALAEYGPTCETVVVR